MKNIIILSTSILAALLFSSLYTGSGIRTATEEQDHQAVDTLKVNDSIIQIVYWKQGHIDRIRLSMFRNWVHERPDLMESGLEQFVSDQDIQFHDNGSMRSMSMTNGIRLEERKGYSVFVYADNSLEFSEKGVLLHHQFMKDFKRVSSYDSKPPRKKKH